MGLFHDVEDRNTLLVASGIRSYNVDHFAGAIRKLSVELDRKIKVVFIADAKKSTMTPALIKKIPNSSLLLCDTYSLISLENTLLPLADKLLAVLCRIEDDIPLFKRVIPHVPYLLTPNAESLDWTTNKIQMRRRLATFNPKISPIYSVAEDSSKTTIDRIIKKVGFPMVIKPAGLAASLLVSVCYDEEEFSNALKNAFSHLKKAYRDYQGRGEPQILVEQFLEGTMYSIDAYVNARGRVYTCPPVHVKTGRAIGIDDFHGYQQLTPVKLQKHRVEQAESIAKDAVLALGLRNLTCHIEMIVTERKGWKIIEVAARPGGFRDILYNLAYGFDHAYNDILIRLPKRPEILRKPKGYAVAMKFFPRKEGILDNVVGLEKLKKFESFYRLMVNKKNGEMCMHAKHGGKSVFDVIMFNQNRAKLIADIRRLERLVTIYVEPKKSSKK